MTDADHPDEVERLRAALWGDERVERHAAACGPCAADVAYQRSLRDVFRRWAEAAPPARVCAAAREADDVDTAPIPWDVSWLTATPVAQAGGVRSPAAADLHVVCDAGSMRVDVLLHHLPTAGRCSLSGQVLLPDASPLARTRVTLFVDGRRDVSTESDDFGEFAFSGVRGKQFGLGIGADAQVAHIAIPPRGGVA